MTDYMSKKFMGMKHYNNNLGCNENIGSNGNLGSISFKDGTSTGQFLYERSFITRLIDSTDDRIGIVVRKDTDIVYLYVDKNSNLFYDSTGDECIGCLCLTDHIWNGTANIDIRTIRKRSPCSIVEI
jgi:hypothetical protein